MGLIGVRVKVRVWVWVKVRVCVRVVVTVRVRVRVRGAYKGCSLLMRVASSALASKGIYWGKKKSKREEETRREVCG